MSEQKTSIFSRIDVLIKKHVPITSDIESVTKIEFFNSSFILSGNFIIFLTEDENEKTITHKIYNLTELIGYKCYK